MAGKKAGGGKKAAQKPAQREVEVLVDPVPEEEAVSPPAASPTVAAAALGTGDRIDWLRVKFVPGNADESDLVCWGMFGRRLDGLLEILLYTTDGTDEAALVDGGTIYVERSKVVSFGYESSFVLLQQQHDMAAREAKAAKPVRRATSAR